ncbi:hypothetical protein [Pseudooctadecabacter jejudonensis]|uniref:Uncharacterized protein n=1 Tax=Pseudooctadecabacter jejudonensis TaxID=1391910 RepID=A0A1Y5T3R7_9RHOB|nr:hypothetical protein [Pseudooctadecabacter jejudonensis]SLN54641.1 hypothetical protein PSJ8397_02856 [Pseudooctadecabacter jejudonensis]
MRIEPVAFLLVMVPMMVPAQPTELCQPTEAGLYTQDCIDDLRQRPLRAAATQARRTCDQVASQLNGQPYFVQHLGNAEVGTLCHVAPLDLGSDDASGLLAQLDAFNGDDDNPALPNGNNPTNWQNVVPEDIAALQAFLDGYDPTIGFPQIGGTGEAIVVEAPSYSNQGVFVDPVDVQQFKFVDSVGDSTIYRATPEVRLLIDNATNQLLEMDILR